MAARAVEGSGTGWVGPQAFASYASVDQELALELIRAQGIRGVTLRDGRQSAEETQDSIATADAVVCLVSPHWLSSEFAQREISQIKSLRKRIVLAYLVDPASVETPADLSMFPALNFYLDPHVPRRSDELATTIRARTDSVIQVSLHRGDAGDQTESLVCEDLAQLLVFARRINEHAGDEGEFTLSYSSLCAAFSITSDPWSHWFRQLLRTNGLGRQSLFPKKDLSEERCALVGSVDHLTSEFATPMRMTRTATALLAEAGEFALSLSKATEPAARHLLAALVFGTNKRRLAELGIKVGESLASLLAAVEYYFPSELEAWKDLARRAWPVESDSQMESAAQTAESFDYAAKRWTHPGMSTDRVQDEVKPEDDQLNVKTQAEHFAMLLCARDAVPPIALGLFGDWGTGKSFFMGLVRHHVTRLTQREGASPFVARAVQIEFNAWHYQDTNLWATLALRIFEGLAKPLAQTSKRDVSDVRREINAKLESSQAHRKDFKRKRDSALEERKKHATELIKLQAERERAKTAGLVKRAKNVWDAVVTDKEFKASRTELEKAAKRFGLEQALDSREDFRRLENQLEDLGTRSRSLAAALGAKFEGKSALLSPFILMAVVGVAIGLSWLVDPLSAWLAREVEWISTSYAEVSVVVVQLSVMASGVMAWIGRQAAAYQRGLSALERMRARYAQLESAQEQSAEEIRTREELLRIDNEIAKCDQEIAEAEELIDEATAELQRINHGGLVYDFLAGRQQDTRYRGELGLISTIREDLSQLAVLLNDYKDNGDHPVERIILYIDDLDRCKPKEVVDVLQAVHLLLAIPLFNVVVGVDPRWLHSALFESYGNRDDSVGEFSPQDYLEKIFQIPFSLASMAPDGYKALIDKLVATKPRPGKTKTPSVKTSETTTPETGTETQEVTPSPAPTSVKPDVVVPGGELPTTPLAEEPGESAEEEVETVRIEDLLFDSKERDFLRLLHDFIDTPRRANRLVNVYRLLRLGASSRGAKDLEDFLDGEFKVAASCLALLIGHPRLGAELLRSTVRDLKDTSWCDYLEELIVGEGSTLTQEDRATLKSVRESFLVLRDEHGLSDAFKLYKDWSPRVGCYSFDWHSLDRGRDASRSLNLVDSPSR